MNTNDKNLDLIIKMVRDKYIEAEPQDSWESLRTRIDDRIRKENLHYKTALKWKADVVFWRRLTLVVAACFIFTTGILIYFIGLNYGKRLHEKKEVATVNLLDKMELKKLSSAFSEVQQLFGQKAQWIVVGNSNNIQIGVLDEENVQKNNQIIVLRLEVNSDKSEGKGYYDVITFLNRKTEFDIPFAKSQSLKVFLTPSLRPDGSVAVETKAGFDESSWAKNIAAINNNSFTSLIGLRTNGNWVNINGTGEIIPKIL